ncbi:hypothetical protein BGX27_009947 [Mortierella sp. AM989]|nr:hypothetical protein BGX27_009947 [Mortierella sp. AM989]
MFKKVHKASAAPSATHNTTQQNQFSRLSNTSSSNALTSSHSHIPMYDLQSNNNDNGSKLHSDVEIEHDPLPPAVDFTGVTPTARYQFRALARRALSYHRRQRFTNIACLVLWPIILVLLCLLLSLIGRDKSRYYVGDVSFCPNDIDVQESTSFSIKRVPFPTGNEAVPAAAWYPPSFTESGYSTLNPCVRWFGESFPPKAPYENISAEAAAQPDSYYTTPPANGWFKWLEEKSRSRRYNSYFSALDSINQIVYYLAVNNQVAQALGTLPGVTRTFNSTTWPPTNASIHYNVSAPGVSPGTGLLGAIPVRYSNMQMYGEITDTNGTSDYGTYYTYSAQQFLPVQDQASLDKTILDTVNQNAEPMYSSISQPFGAIIYNELDPSKSTAKATMQFGQGSRVEPSTGLKQIITMTQITNAMVKTKYNGQYAISQGLRALPYVWNTHILDGVLLNQVSLILFPFGLAFLLPTFVSILVQEKEDRHRMMMAMNGLKTTSYYMAHYLEFMTMQLILNFIFCCTAAAIGSQIIHRTNPLIIIVILLLWAHVQVSLSFVLAALFSKTRRASLVVYFIVAISCIMGGVATTIFSDGIPFAWFIHPSFAFFNIISTGVLQASRVNGLYPLIWSDFAPGNTLFGCVMIMLGESILFLILTFYFDAVLPSEYGVQKPWHFPISSLFKRNRSAHDPESHIASTQHDNYTKGLNDEDVLEGGDADVYAERDRVRTTYNPENTPLIIQNLFHRYPGKVEPALRGMTFGVENNTVLGLLGPNGAGKSTMIHLLTGLYSPTSGTAYVAGANIRTNMDIVHSKIGVCPQHDILWGDLTVADHLLFYSRLRGIPPQLEQQAVTYAIASVSLTKFRDRQVKGLSGGEKRRVSIAISLLGDNAVIFLDEPSTGLDPAVRRVIWNIINRVKANRTIVLTTHSMEEADILSDRIAIMTAGRLRCIGSSLHLKELYGSGFRLNISSKPGRLQEACENIQTQVLKGLKYRRIDKFTNATTFEFELDTQQQQEGRGQLSSIFAALSKTDRFPAIEDWGVSQTTLEDVFIKIVTEGDSALAVPQIVTA